MKPNNAAPTIIEQWSIAGVGRFRVREIRTAKYYDFVVEFQKFDVPFGTGKWEYIGIQTETVTGAAFEILSRLDAGMV